MCNNYCLHFAANQQVVPFRALGEALAFPGGVPNLAKADYHIGNGAPTVTFGASGPHLAMTSWAKRADGRARFQLPLGRSFFRPLDSLPDPDRRLL